MSPISCAIFLLSGLAGLHAGNSPPRAGKPPPPRSHAESLMESAQISPSGQVAQVRSVYPELRKKTTMRAERMQVHDDASIQVHDDDFSLLQVEELNPMFLMTQMSDEGFKKYKAKFGRTYEDGSPEHVMRVQVYMNRMSAMFQHNMMGRDWTQGVNQFTDRTDEELKRLLGYRRSSGRSAEVAQQASLLDEGVIVNSTNLKSRTTTTCAKNICVSGETCTAAGKCEKCDVGLRQTSKDSVDWSEKIEGAKDSIMDQGGCGSCWAIASAGAIELQLAQLHPSQKLHVSPEAIMQCSPNPKHCGGDGGCQGSTPELAFEWVKNNPIQSLESVPYTQQDNPDKQAWCHNHEQGTASMQDAISIGGFVHLPVNAEEPVVQALVCSGPVVAAAWASTWSSYQSGILSCPTTGSVTVDHAILLVGFGVADNGKHYWRIRNSWGKTFGENGFLRLARHPGNETARWDEDMQQGVGCKNDAKRGKVAGECGILSDTAYPVGTKVTSKPLVY